MVTELNCLKSFDTKTASRDEWFGIEIYSYRVSEAKKVDHLLHEIDGSRRMANQIAQRVFVQQGCKQDRCIAGAEVSKLIISRVLPDLNSVCGIINPKAGVVLGSPEFDL